MIPYYILKCNTFDLNANEYNTSSQQAIDTVKDNEPHTSFKKRNLQIIDGFIKYDLTCETELKKKGRAYGTDDIFQKFILIDEDTFYHNTRNELLILKSNKEVFCKFINDMKDNRIYSFEKIKVDFNKIINNRYSLGIQGIWLGQIPDEINVTTLSMFGCNIEDSNKYNQLLKEGAKIKNLSIVYNHNGNQERIMITKDGGIILYRSMDESDALLLVEDVYINMLAPNS